MISDASPHSPLPPGTPLHLSPAVLWLLVILILSAASCARNGTAIERPAEFQTGGISYEVIIEGKNEELPDDLKEWLLSLSSAASKSDRPPRTMSILRRRAEEDVEPFIRALRARGFFEAVVELDIRENTDPAQVVFQVAPGPSFKLERVSISLLEPLEVKPPDANKLELAEGEPFKAEDIEAGRKRLLTRLAHQGYPFARVPDTRIVADYAINGVLVTYFVQPGPRATFGPTEITGLTTVEKDYLRGRISWEEGTIFDAESVRKTRARMLSTGLFSSVDVSTDELRPDNSLPMKINVRERDHRTVKAGIYYNTDFGPGIRLGWEHRNLFGEAESLDTSLDINDVIKSISGIFSVPEFFRRNQRLIVRSDLRDERPDAYTSTRWNSSGVFERDLTETISVGAGLGYLFAEEAEQNENEEFWGLTYVPFYVTQNTANDVLNPTRGYRIWLEGAPYVDVFGNHSEFFKHRAFLNLYVKLGVESLVLALRGQVGQILGAERTDVPPSERFYAGGGGSVRGYPYQTVGALDGNDPIGGKSLLESSMEIRWRIGDFGVVPFLDGGYAYQKSSPDPSEDYLWGAGLGIRYYTDFGPIRLDVAVPLNEREEVDDSFQVYISIGQAF